MALGPELCPLLPEGSRKTVVTPPAETPPQLLILYLGKALRRHSSPVPAAFGQQKLALTLRRQLQPGCHHTAPRQSRELLSCSALTGQVTIQPGFRLSLGGRSVCAWPGIAQTWGCHSMCAAGAFCPPRGLCRLLFTAAMKRVPWAPCLTPAIGQRKWNTRRCREPASPLPSAIPIPESQTLGVQTPSSAPATR